MSYTKLLILILLLSSCDSDKNNSYELTGKAQGTTFSIKYYGETSKDYSIEISTILKDIDQVASLWVQDSEITRFNKDSSTEMTINDINDYFKDIFIDSKSVFKRTNGYFNPSVNELVEFWGFGLSHPDSVESDRIPDIISRMSFTDIVMTNSKNNHLTINKTPDSQLNFNAIAQGYAVDVVSNFLLSKGLSNHLIEIGGELEARGNNQQGEAWNIGIDRPSEGDRITDHEVLLRDKSMATSGSYRKYIIRDGKRFSHTINPLTGYPVSHNLLSATVMMESCSLADAYATSFMVMGVEKTIDFLKKNKDLGIEVLLTYENGSELESYVSEGFFVDSEE